MEWATCVGKLIRADLDGSVKATLLAIMAYTEAGSDLCFEDQETLAIAASCSVRTVRTAIEKAKEYGLLEHARTSRGLKLRYIPSALPRAEAVHRAQRSVKQDALKAPKPPVPKAKLKAYQELVELCPEPGCPLKVHVASLEAQSEAAAQEATSAATQSNAHPEESFNASEPLQLF